MTDKQQRRIYKERYGVDAPKQRKLKWLKNRNEKDKELFEGAQEIGYNGDFKVLKIRNFIRRESANQNYEIPKKRIFI